MLPATSFAESDRFMQPQAALKQIGMGTVLAISGGRWVGIGSTLKLPVSNGYSVRVTLAGNDTYTVERVFKRGYRYTIRRVTGVYCTELGETCYEASNFRTSPKWGELVSA